MKTIKHDRNVSFMYSFTCFVTFKHPSYTLNFHRPLLFPASVLTPPWLSYPCPLTPAWHRRIPRWHSHFQGDSAVAWSDMGSEEKHCSCVWDCTETENNKTFWEILSYTSVISNKPTSKNQPCSLNSCDCVVCYASSNSLTLLWCSRSTG